VSNRRVGAPVPSRRATTSLATFALTHFGLARARVVDSLVVRLPSGRERVLTGVRTNQVIAVDEPQPGA
jgi:hypothetical protein